VAAMVAAEAAVAATGVAAIRLSTYN
jgi:hypothetical protein